jgi:LysM repeat protein
MQGLFSAIFPHEITEAQKDEPVVLVSAQTAPLLKAALNADPNPVRGGGDVLVEEGALVPDGEISLKEKKVNTLTANGEISVYVVREGDTLSQIAEMYDVSAKTILWANNIASASTIKPGDALVILPITGVRHVVKKGDTIASIAKKYSGDAEEILSYNQLATASDIHVGDTVLIPDGTIIAPQPAKTVAPKKTNRCCFDR